MRPRLVLRVLVSTLLGACGDSASRPGPDASASALACDAGAPRVWTLVPCANSHNEVLVSCACTAAAPSCPYRPTDGDVCMDTPGTACAFEGQPPGCTQIGPSGGVCTCSGGRWTCDEGCWERCPVVDRDALNGEPCNFTGECILATHTCRCLPGDGGRSLLTCT